MPLQSGECVRVPISAPAAAIVALNFRPFPLPLCFLGIVLDGVVVDGVVVDGIVLEGVVVDEECDDNLANRVSRLVLEEFAPSAITANK